MPRNEGLEVAAALGEEPVGMEPGREHTALPVPPAPAGGTAGATGAGSVGTARHIHLVESKADSGETSGWSAIVGLELDGCPAERSPAGRQEAVLARRLRDQADLITALHCKGCRRSYAIRYITRPKQGAVSADNIDIVLFVKCIAPDRDGAEAEAERLLGQLRAVLFGMMPDHVWTILSDESRFMPLWSPFDWDTAQVAEIRRREELIELKRIERHKPARPSLGRPVQAPKAPEPVPSDTVYFVHRFLPRSTSLESVFRAMLAHGRPLVWQITLTPTELAAEESNALVTQIAKCEDFLTDSRPAGDRSPEQTFFSKRARAIADILAEQYATLQDTPFLMSLAVASDGPLPGMLLEATGTQVTDGAQPLGGGYDCVLAGSDDDARIARDSMRFLECEPFAVSSVPKGMERLRFLVDAAEAAAAFRFPTAASGWWPGMDIRFSRYGPAPNAVMAPAAGSSGADHVLLGENRFLGRRSGVTLPAADRLQHYYVIGQTGTGKSTLLKKMILDDISAGRGVGVIDPHGDLFEELLELIPESRMKDVVLIDPSSMDHPVGINMLECESEERRYFVARELAAIIRRLMWDDYGAKSAEWLGPVFFQHMQMNLLLAMSNPHRPGTLLEFYQIFQSRKYWKRWLPLQTNDTKLRQWVDITLPALDYTARTDAHHATWGEYLSGKFEEFVFDPKLRLIFGQPRSTIDLQAIMNKGQILLVNLAKGRLAEANSRFFGMVLMSMLLSAAMSRIALKPAARRPFYLYVDEFQSLATDSFSILLSEARKFGMGLVLANQFLSQIRDQRIVTSLTGNVGTLISFRVGRDDAALLENGLAPFFDQTDLMNLPNWQAYLRATVNGQVTVPCSVDTVKSGAVADVARARRLRRRAQGTYGRPRADVEAMIAQSLGDGAKGEGPGKQ